MITWVGRLLFSGRWEKKKEQNRRRTKFRVENEMSDFTFVSWQLSLEAVPWFMVIDDDASRGT